MIQKLANALGGYRLVRNIRYAPKDAICAVARNF